MLKKLLKAIGLLFLVMLIVATFFVVKEIKNREKIKKEAYEFDFDKLLAEKGIEIAIPEVDMTNWKIYESHEYGFSFKYPNDWTIKEIFEKNMPSHTSFLLPKINDTTARGLRGTNRLVEIIPPKRICPDGFSKIEEKISFEEEFADWTGEDDWSVRLNDIKRLEKIHYVAINGKGYYSFSWNFPPSPLIVTPEKKVIKIYYVSCYPADCVQNIYSGVLGSIRFIE